MKELNNYIEHTLLKQDATHDDFVKLFGEAIQNKFLGVCIPPSVVAMAHQALEGTGVKVVTVVGFPLGANKSEVKAFETSLAVKDGADEIDMVINVSLLKDKDFQAVQTDIEKVKVACEDKPLKVILETDLLTKEEIENACKICVNAKVDFVKTSTGFVKNGVGAKAEDVALMYKIVSPYGIKVKASAGIRDKEKALAMVNAGA
ncbi:deoxyribose-phosphate aldolase, partial [bacterium]|nr:deoxyribose-phosphate aldolase [bacterium]